MMTDTDEQDSEYYKVSSFRFLINPDQKVLGLQVNTTNERNMILTFEGNGAPVLKEGLDQMIQKYPEIMNWKGSDQR
jgi:hypothetical protein